MQAIEATMDSIEAMCAAHILNSQVVTARLLKIAVSSSINSSNYTRSAFAVVRLLGLSVHFAIFYPFIYPPILSIYL